MESDMGKYNVRQTPPPERPWDVHPVWRMFGCLLVIIGPLVAFAAAHFAVEYIIQEGIYPIPGDLRGGFTLPFVNYYLPHFYATLIMTGVFIILGAAGITFLYALIYSILGPKRYGPLDAEPIRTKGKKKRR